MRKSTTIITNNKVFYKEKNFLDKERIVWYYNITYINIDNLTEFDTNLFYHKDMFTRSISKLSFVNISNIDISILDRYFVVYRLMFKKVKNIKDCCFKDINLHYLEFVDNKLEKIGNEAFTQNKIKYLNIPINVNTIGKKAFADNKIFCLNLEYHPLSKDERKELKKANENFEKEQKFIFNEKINTEDQRFNDDLWNKLQKDIDIKYNYDNFLIIEEEAFMNNFIKYFQIQRNELHIKKRAFKNNYINAIDFFANKLTIEKDAFSDCNVPIEKITFHVNELNIHPEAFDKNNVKEIAICEKDYDKLVKNAKKGHCLFDNPNVVIKNLHPCKSQEKLLKK